MSATSSGAKFKVFGFLKGLFQKPDAGKAAIDEQADNKVPTAPQPPTPPSTARAVRNGNGSGGTHSTRQGAATLSISLSGILNHLPADLKAKVRQPDVGDLTVSVGLEKILSQLSHGAVKVPFGDIRQAAPNVFAAGDESDRIAVLLPLNEILTQLNPALLVRRPAQKQVEVPSEIASPFDAKGQGLVFSVGNAKPVTPAAPRQAVPAPATPARGAISSVPAPKAPSAAAPISMPKAKTPVAPAAPVVPDADIPIIPFKPKSPLSPAGAEPIAGRQAVPKSPAIPVVPPRAVVPAFPSAPLIAATLPQAQVPQVQAPQTQAPAEQKPQSQPASPGTTGPRGEPLAVALKALAESWPETLRQEIVQSKLLDARILLPCEAIEAALKGGRAAFPWKTLRSWIQPVPLPTDSANDEAELELPLKVVTPLFFARKNGALKSTQRVTIDEGIPNLFFGFPAPEGAPAPVATPAGAEPMLVRPSAAPAAKAGPVVQPVDTNYYVWDDTSDTAIIQESEYKRKTPGGTDFVARYATPNEIVSRAAALDGVAGALIALPDGLMVASRIPSELNGDTLAAFLPQIFAKVNQCTRELRMGELNNLNFTVGNVPWKIFRVNAIFFAAFGRVAEPLPTAELAALAAELDRKQK